jgi:restriction endonuclease S subunit
MISLCIKEFSKVKGGKRLPKGHSYSESKTEYPYLRVTDFEKYTINSSNLKYLKEDTQLAIKRYIISKDDVYISIAGTIGRVGYIPKSLDGANLTENAAKITEIKGFEVKYLVYFLSSIVAKNQISLNTKATSQPKLALYRIESISVPLAPLPEQRAIVAKIEQLFSELDNGIANLKTAKDKLEIYRQAVLKKAFEGELTKEWRERQLVKREDWHTHKLGDVLKTIDGDRGKNYPKKKEFMDSGFCLFLSTKNVRQGNFVFDDNLFISEEKDRILRGGKLERNDVVITTRGTLGNVALYDKNVKFQHIRINSGMLILRVNNSKELSQKFLMRFINSSLFFQQLRAKQSGTAQPQIPANILREIEIEVPKEIEEQNQIIQEIETRLSVCDNAIKNIDQALEKSEALRQSILKKAFEGKLLSDAELQACRKEADWEPAEKLLERIRKEKK